ncbi:hypothetical protein ACQR13_29320 [Bradyrhizobium sp. HKCCYLRH3059]|uniref:hypothetical protein n=1 Tax=Bradyrhizobium sp. HKCCYLRH3059 TaxID=3420745 RepID=UPI003EBDF8F4
MTALRFQFQDVLNEVSSFNELARKYIAPASLEVLPRFYQALENYRNMPTKEAIDWKIADSCPLCTIPAKEYEPGGGGHRAIVGEITCIWRIKREPLKKTTQPAKHFSLIGNASTRVRLKYPATDSEPAQEVAMWRMEVADGKAPGCYFHVQILGQSDELPFPKSIPVPRLPSIILTPLAVAEFVLAELFQDAWGKHTAALVPHLQRWAPIQRERLKRLLYWKLKELEQTSGSPWSALKAAKPDPALFI